MRLACILLFVLLIPISVSAQTVNTVTLYADHDTTIFEDFTSNSGGGGPLYVGHNATGSRRRSLIRFHWPGPLLPPSVQVLSATMELNVSQVQTVGPAVGVNFAIWPVTKQWEEGSQMANGQNGAPAATPAATWVDAMHMVSAWNTPGGDWNAGAQIDSFHVTGPGPIMVSSVDLILEVKSWLTGTNYGLMLREHQGGLLVLDSDEVGARRPKITITYSLCAQDAECEDNNPCTTNTCNAGQCTFPAVVDGTACGGAPAICEQQDVCRSGVCVDEGLQPVGTACGDQTATACDLPDQCDANGLCIDRYLQDGEHCGTVASTCEFQDVCESKVCVDKGFAPSGTACGDPSQSECNGPDSCDGAGVCQSNFKPVDTPCGSSDVTDCDGADTCNATGVCQLNFALAGTACGKLGTVCEPQDTCRSGACVDAGFAAAGTPCGDQSATQCDAPDSCDASGTCGSNLEPDGTECDGTDFCTSGDFCVAGLCGEGTNETCDADEKCDEAQDHCYAACGDGELDSGEVCDNGPMNSDTDPDACRTDCSVPSCGDGVVDTGEGCDAGDENSDEPGAACRLNCAPMTCGDGVVDPGEECDRGIENSDVADLCRTTCLNPVCGDGIVDTGEMCDDGAQNSDVAVDGCRTDCTAAGCGDGVVDTGEECDDEASDACSDECTLLSVEDMGMADAGADPETVTDDQRIPIVVARGGTCATSQPGGRVWIVALFLFALVGAPRRRD